MNKKFLIGPAVFTAIFAALLVVWAALEPATLVRTFDAGGRSPFEIGTLFFYFAIIPCIWIFNPFKRRAFAIAVTVVVVMAILKQLDLHNEILHFFYPSYVTEQGSLAAGLYKPNGAPLTGTPFKMRVITNASVPLGMKTLVITYFAFFFGLFAVMFTLFFNKWIKGVFSLDACSWAWGSFGVAAVFVQIADRLPSWLNHSFGLEKLADGGMSAAQSLCTVIEEGNEFTMAVLALVTIYLGWRKLNKREEKKA